MSGMLTRAIEELLNLEPLARELAREKGINSMCCRLKPEGNYILCVNICEPIGIRVPFPFASVLPLARVRNHFLNSC